MRSFLPLIRDEWRLLLFGFVMTFGSSLGQTYFIGLFNADIRADLGLSHGDFGGIYSAATLVSAVLLLWSGSLIDRVDLRLYSLLVCTGLAGGCLLLALSQSPLVLFIAMLALRHLGQGLMGLAGPTAMVRYLDRQRGKANAISGIGYSLSEAVLPSAVIALLGWLSWRQSWIFWGAILLVLVPVLSYRLLRGHGVRHELYLEGIRNGNTETGESFRRQWSRGEVMRDPCFYLFLPALLAQPMLFTGFMFHQVQLVEEKSWSLAAWGGLYVFYAAVSALCKLLMGLLVDRFGAVRAVPLVCLPLGAGLLFLGLFDGFWAAAAFMGLMAISVGGYATLSSPFYSEMYGTLHLGAIKSLTASAMVFATAVAPLLMGWLIDIGTGMHSMALGSVAYVLLASGLAFTAVKLRQGLR